MPKKADLWRSNPKEAEITKDQLYVRQSKPTGNAVAFEVAEGSRSLHFEFARAFYKRNLGGEKLVPQHETTTIMVTHFQHSALRVYLMSPKMD